MTPVRNRVLSIHETNGGEVVDGLACAQDELDLHLHFQNGADPAVSDCFMMDNSRAAGVFEPQHDLEEVPQTAQLRNRLLRNWAVWELARV